MSKNQSSRFSTIINKKGKLIFITGPMFARKTNKMIRYIRYFRQKDFSFIVFKPKINTRSPDYLIRTHDLQTEFAVAVKNPSEIWKIYEKKIIKPQKIFINEINFFSNDIIDVIKKLITEGTSVICEGLLKDYQDNYFTVSQKIVKIATKTLFLRASCNYCFNPAIFSKRLINNKQIILIGGSEKYAASCNECFK